METITIVLLCWCGLLSLLWLVSIILVCILFSKVGRRNNSNSGGMAPHNYVKNPRVNNPSVYSYGSPEIEPGEDLARRGYSKHEKRSGPPSLVEERTMKPTQSPYNANPNTSQSRDDDFGGIFFADEYKSSKAPPKKPPQQQPPLKNSPLDVPHFFNSQLSQSNPGHSSNLYPSNQRNQGQGFNNPNFQY